VEKIDGKDPRLSLVSGPRADGHGAQEFLVLPSRHEVTVSLHLPVLGGSWQSENMITIPFNAVGGRSYRIRFRTMWIGEHPDKELKWKAWIEEEGETGQSTGDQ